MVVYMHTYKTHDDSVYAYNKTHDDSVYAYNKTHDDSSKHTIKHMMIGAARPDRRSRDIY